MTPTAAGPGLEQRDRAVDTAAHRYRHPVRVGWSRNDRTDRIRERVDRKRLAADGRRLEQRQAR